MDLLGSLLGGQQQQQDYDDFANRYDQGAPWDGISDDEAYNRYSQLAPQLPPDVYQRAAQDSFSRLSPQQRSSLGRYISQRAPQYGVNFPDADMNGQDDRFQDPGFLAQMTGQMHQQQPGLLGQILGGSGGSGGGGMLENPIAKAALGGIAAMAFKQMVGGRR